MGYTHVNDECTTVYRYQWTRCAQINSPSYNFFTIFSTSWLKGQNSCACAFVTQPLQAFTSQAACKQTTEPDISFLRDTTTKEVATAFSQLASACTAKPHLLNGSFASSPPTLNSTATASGKLGVLFFVS